MDKTGYKITKWHGIDNYECEYCSYATTDLARMGRHQQARHGLQALANRRTVLVATKRGKQVRPQAKKEIEHETHED